MIVVIGGMIRSGSTFSFNIAREILGQEGPVNVASANSLEQFLLENPTQANFILKTHAPDVKTLSGISDGSLPCICTIRTPEDAIASWMQTFGFPMENSIFMVRQWLSWYSSVKDKVLTLDYQSVEAHPQRVIKKIAEYLEKNCSDRFLEILEKRYNKAKLKDHYDLLIKSDNTVDLGFSYYDKGTFFHRRHISLAHARVASATLSSAEIDFIRTELRDYDEILAVQGVSVGTRLE